MPDDDVLTLHESSSDEQEESLAAVASQVDEIQTQAVAVWCPSR